VVGNTREREREGRESFFFSFVFLKKIKLK